MIRFALALLLASSALSQPDDSTIGDAKRYFDEGQVLYLQSRFPEAADQFEKAYSAKPLSAFLYNEAVCREKSGQFVEAIDRYARYIVSDPRAPERPEIERRIEGLRQKLHPEAATGKTPDTQAPLPTVSTRGVVVIESNPSGASIWLDDRSLDASGLTPFTTTLEGKHTVYVELQGYKPDKEQIEFNPGALTHVRVTLSEEHYLGWVEIVTPGVPGADVYLDQRDAGVVGKTPFMGNLPPGKHKIWIERIGFAPVERDFEVAPGGTHRIEVQPKAIRHGFLAIAGRTTQGATVTVDERKVDCRGSYPCRIELPPGKFHVAVVSDGKKPYEQDVEIVGQRETKLRVQLQEQPPRTSAYITLGISAALLGGGVVFGVKSSHARESLDQELDDKSTLVADNDERLDQGKLYAALADGFFIVGGLVSAIGLYYLFSDEGLDSIGDSEITPLAVSPYVTPDGGGLAAAVRF